MKTDLNINPYGYPCKCQSKQTWYENKIRVCVKYISDRVLRRIIGSNQNYIGEIEIDRPLSRRIQFVNNLLSYSEQENKKKHLWLLQMSLAVATTYYFNSISIYVCCELDVLI